MQRVVQLPGHLAFAAGEIRAPDRSDEQRVAGDHEPGLVATAQVAHDQADAVRGVSGRVHHVDKHVAGFDALAVGEGREVEAHAAPVAFVQVVRGAGAPCECRAAGVVVGVHVGVDHVDDARPRPIGLRR